MQIVFYLAMFLKTIDQVAYEELVQEILQLRAKSPFVKFSEFKKNSSLQY